MDYHSRQEVEFHAKKATSRWLFVLSLKNFINPTWYSTNMASIIPCNSHLVPPHSAKPAENPHDEATTSLIHASGNSRPVCHHAESQQYAVTENII